MTSRSLHVGRPPSWRIVNETSLEFQRAIPHRAITAIYHENRAEVST